MHASSCSVFTVFDGIHDSEPAFDPLQIKRRHEDPYLNKLGLKICSACAMLQAIGMIKHAASGVECPVVVYHGRQDKVCPFWAAEQLLGEVSSTDTKMVAFDEGLHDLLHDAEAPAIVEGMVAWIEQHAGS